MNRIDHLFSTKQKEILSVYFTAGFPDENSVVPIIEGLAKSGVDLIEIGVPFSDPMADGPVIQHSSTVAIRGGITLKKILPLIKQARNVAADIPLVLMGYLNPFMQYGFRSLFESCKEVGVDALIIPDLPFADYLKDIKPLCDEFGVPVVMLITPETSPDRIRLIDENTDSFIYMVSAAATTGTRESFGPSQIEYFRRVDKMGLKHPRLIGFGISNPATLREAYTYSSGAIIGSLFIKCLDSQPTISEAIERLFETLGLR